MNSKGVSQLIISKVNKYNLVSLTAYLQIRFKVFVIERKRKIFGEFYYDDFIGNHYNFLVDKKVIGVARVIDRNNVIELGRIAIKKEYRKQSYGKKFINLLIHEIKNIETLKPIILYVEEKSLVAFYQKFGFVESGKECFNNIWVIKMIRLL